jgi:hypothetical protein
MQDDRALVLRLHGRDLGMRQEGRGGATPETTVAEPRQQQLLRQCDDREPRRQRQAHRDPRPRQYRVSLQRGDYFFSRSVRLPAAQQRERNVASC